MSKTNVCEEGLLDLIFLNIAFQGIGDASGLLGSALAGSLYLSLHTGDPGETGNQQTNETAYTGYGRVAVPRSSLGFTRTNSTINLTSAVDFPDCTGNPQTLTHLGIGTASSGVGKLLYKAQLTDPVNIIAGKKPRAKTTTSVTED